MGSASNRFLIVLLFTIISAASYAQSLLDRRVNVNVTRQRLDDVLEILSNAGNFYFSYSSHIVKKDSLVTLTAQNKPVQEVLATLFGKNYEFRESGNYIIIRKAPIRLTMVTNKAVMEDRVYSVTGYVYDEQSGYAIPAASVYEKKLLSSALTDQRGYFKLRLKSGKTSTAELTVSKEAYRDESIVIEPRHNQELTITMIPIENESDQIIISPDDYLVPDSVRIIPIVDTVAINADTVAVEKTKVGMWLLSARQKAQSLNLRNFFTTRPFQVSLTPGLGSHGKLSGQVTNNFSLNVFGGYTAGTNGVEIGGLFNINKRSVRYVQLGGLLNVVGGKVEGMQIAGLNNTVLDSVRAFQAAGVNNIVNGNFKGFQVGGVYNHVSETVSGFQAAGVANFARRKVNGLQLAGVINFSNRETNGVQISGVFNYSRVLRGVQFGLINIADTSDGYSIGLINIILKGYHKLSFSTNELMNLNAAFKTGNSKFYSILLAGMNLSSADDKVYSFGYGLGSEIDINKRRTLSINPEISSQYVYLGTWDYLNLLNKAHLNFNVKFGKYVSLFAGPSYAVYISDQPSGMKGYRFPLLPSGYRSHTFSNRVTGWFGWNVGINFF